MLFARIIILLSILCSVRCWAGVAVDLSFGRSVSGNFNIGKSLPVEQQNFALCFDYLGGLNRGLFGTGNERFGLGLGIYTAQVSYMAGNVKNTGGNFFMTARTGWLISAFNKTWLFQLTPELVFFSKMSVASYSQTTIDGENFQSASLSVYSGNGALRLPFYAAKKLNMKLGKADLFVGGSLSSLIQTFSKREDTVVATSPSTGKVNSLEKSSSGSYTLQTLSLQFHLTFVM